VTSPISSSVSIRNREIVLHASSVATAGVVRNLPAILATGAALSSFTLKSFFVALRLDAGASIRSEWAVGSALGFLDTASLWASSGVARFGGLAGVDIKIDKTCRGRDLK
jgi:hypothetical protein